MGYLLGIDLGSSSVKAALVDVQGGCVATAFMPCEEMTISSPEPGFAEQDPEMWYENTCAAVRAVLHKSSVAPADIKAIGISYQMHGLVCVDKNQNVLRPAIIWCDSRAARFIVLPPETVPVCGLFFNS